MFCRRPVSEGIAFPEELSFQKVVPPELASRVLEEASTEDCEADSDPEGESRTVGDEELKRISDAACVWHVDGSLSGIKFGEYLATLVDARLGMTRWSRRCRQCNWSAVRWRMR